MHQAVCRADTNIVEALCETDGALVDITDVKSKMTPLVLGCYLGSKPDHLKCFQILVKHPKIHVQFVSKHGSALGILREREDIGIRLRSEAIDFLSTTLAKEQVDRNMSEGIQRALEKAEEDEKDVESEAEEFRQYVIEQLCADSDDMADVVCENLADIGITTLDKMQKKCQPKALAAAFAAFGAQVIPDEDLTEIEYWVSTALTDLPLIYVHRMVDIFRMNVTLKVYNNKLESSTAKHLPPPVAIAKWRTGRHSWNERRAIKNKREGNLKAQRRKASIKGKTDLKATAKVLSQDVLANTRMDTESHRDGCKSSRPGVIGLPGTPDLPKETDLRTMLLEHVAQEESGACFNCSGEERRLAPVHEGQFANITVGVKWHYNLHTCYQVRYLKHNVFPSNCFGEEYFNNNVHESASSIVWHNLETVWDFTTAEL
jgi:hypothetical protein